MFAFLGMIGDQSEINVQTTDTNDVGPHEMLIEVLLDMYGVRLESKFNIQINDDRPCEITDLSVTPGQDLTIEYQIEIPSAPQTKPFPTLDVVPSDCFQTYTYEIIDKNT